MITKHTRKITKKPSIIKKVYDDEDMSRIKNTITTCSLNKITFNEKSLRHTYSRKDFKGRKLHNVSWNFEAPVLLHRSKKIKVITLQKVAESLRNNFGVDITKDIKVKASDINQKEKGSKNYKLFQLRLSNMTSKDVLIKRIASCLFVLGIVEFKDNVYSVSLDKNEPNEKNREDTFVVVNNPLLYGKNKFKKFKQKVFTSVYSLRPLRLIAFDEVSKITSSKNRETYFKTVKLTVNNMYSHCIFANILKLSKVIPSEEANSIIEALVRYGNYYIDKKSYDLKNEMKVVACDTLSLIKDTVKKDSKGLDKSITKVFNVSVAKKIKKRDNREVLIYEFIKVLSEYFTTEVVSLERHNEVLGKIEELKNELEKTKTELTGTKSELSKMKEEYKMVKNFLAKLGYNLE